MPNLAKSLADSAESSQVVGPASATDNAVARYDGATGKLLQNSLVTIADNGDISLPASRTVDGRDVSADGATLDGHTTSIAANTAAIATKADVLQDVVTVAGTTHTVAESDIGKLLDCTSGSAVTITVPDTFTVAAGKRAVVSVLQGGAGQVTVVGSGTRVMSANGLTNKTRAQGAEIAISLRGATVARVGGDCAVA